MPAPRTFRLLLALPFWVGLSAVALAGGSTQPFERQVDPALLTASRADIEGRLRRACAFTQAKVQNVSEASLAGPCNCYATRALRSFSDADLRAYRETGVFDESGRAKALRAIDSCRLKRPV